VVRLVKNTNFIEFREDDRLLPTGAPDFDASTLELWGPLLNGSTLHPVKKDLLLDMQTLKQIIRKYRITIMWMTSPLFNQVSEVDIGLFKGLRTLLVGGDVLSPPHINRLRERFPDLKVINGYGPTENTTFSTTHFIDRDYEITIPIGRPINNSTAYILDKNGCLLPPGVIGELCVGGDGVARGYLNNPELTGEKFRASGFREGERLYRTGDLTRFREGGAIEFAGRIDHQIKIRGHRVELGEIENHLLKMDQVKEAVAVALACNDGDDGNREYDKRLCAYFTAGQPLDPAQLKKYLSVHLPAYMVPVHFVQIEKIPLTLNGKVDRRTLPVPEVQTVEKYTAPRDEREQKLVGIWSEVLGLRKEKIGIEDNFFDLGGHSLRATLLASRIHKEFNIKIPLVEIFSAPTVRELAENMGRTAEDKHISMAAVEKKEYYALSSAQRRLFFLDQFENIGTTYNVSCRMHKFKEKPDIDRVERAVRCLIERHESLRTSFELIANKPVQRIHEQVEFRIDALPVVAGGIEEIIKGFVRPFDLSGAPLFRAGYTGTPENQILLLIDMHHIITDGISMEILLQEFIDLYNEAPLSPLKLQYKDFACWGHTGKMRELIGRQEEYWLKELEGVAPFLNLPLDYKRPAVQSYEGNYTGFRIGDTAGQRLVELAKKTGATHFMVLLSIYNVFLSKITGQDEIVVGTPVSGRRHTELEKIIGIFINMLALRNYPGGDKTFNEFLLEVRERSAAAFENQDYPFEELVEKVVVERDLSHSLLFDTLLSLDGISENSLKISEDNPVPFPGIKEENYEYKDNLAKYDLVLHCFISGHCFHFTFCYCTRLFKHETIERFSDYFKTIVSSILDNPGKQISEIEILSEEEKQQLKEEIGREKDRFSAFEDVVNGNSTGSEDAGFDFL
jgi:non-ribosomal peptide synthetase component F/acyl carrier protein